LALRADGAANESLGLSDADRDSVYFGKLTNGFVNTCLRFQFSMNMYFDAYYLWITVRYAWY